LKINPISSSSNALLKTIRALHDRQGRDKTGLFLLEGRKLVAEALGKGLPIQDIVVSRSHYEQDAVWLAEHELDSISLVEDRLFKELTTTVTPEGIMAVAQVPKHALSDLLDGKNSGAAPLIVVAHCLQDPGNLGTLVRTSLAACASGLILTKGTVDAFNPKVVRSAMGALFALPIVTDVALDSTVQALKEHGIKVLVCDACAAKRYYEIDLSGPLAIVLGNEGQGLTDEDMGLADQLISIPMNPLSESLNVAVSGAIVLFSAVQQRLGRSYLG
jgi:RNA methyltransferase, TrmH family